jgi:hypothetical protein
LQCYDLFQEYLRLYERTLEAFLKESGTSSEEFYKAVREVQLASDCDYEIHFVECLLASADYESFARVMIREARRNLAVRVHGMLLHCITSEPCWAQRRSDRGLQDSESKAERKASFTK